MDTNTLQAFIAVAESRSFSKAADHLYLTQSAISKQPGFRNRSEVILKWRNS